MSRALLGVAWIVGLMIWAGDARAADVERHAICWTPTKQVSYQHWRVWSREQERWIDTRRSCKRRFAKAWGLVRDGKVVGVHKQPTLAHDLPNPNGGQS